MTAAAAAHAPLSCLVHSDSFILHSHLRH
jgi:hypothetical protein